MHDCITTVVGMKVRDTIHFSILLKLGFKSWDNVGRGELSKSS